MSTAIFPLAVWQSGTNENSIPANDNALRMEVVEKAALTIANSAPASPSDGDVHIVGTAWGAFSTNDVVIYKGGTWLGFLPFAGWAKSVGASLYVYSSGAWSPVSGGASSLPPVVTVIGTSHNILDTESGSYLRFTATSAKTCTFRPDATHALPENAQFEIRNVGANNLTLIPGSGVALTPPHGGTLVVPPGGTVAVKRAAADVFDVMGVTV